MGNRHWPMFDLRLTTPDLHLRHLTEADLAALAAILPDDAEQDPSSTSYPGLDGDRNRGVVVHQDYWRARGKWRPESWALSFGVVRDGELVGYQGLEGEDFARLRTVDSSSFLTDAARGQGLGKQMRAAVLALAFGALGARFAVTSAWSDNHASLAVSRALGYVDNGVSAHRRGETVGEMVHMRLTREQWLTSGWGDRVAVEGVDECLTFFGLGSPVARNRETRKADALAMLATPAVDVWVSTASPTGAPHLVPVSLAWVDERAVIAVEGGSVTARNLTASGAARLAVGPTRDLVMIDATLEGTVDVGADGPLATAYVTQADWDPRLRSGYVFLVLRPVRVQAWREANEIAGRTLMRDGSWLV